MLTVKNERIIENSNLKGIVGTLITTNPFCHAAIKATISV